jgi:peptidoglycan hydrolase-like protein with peptidoglycan-binding domain
MPPARRGLRRTLRQGVVVATFAGLAISVLPVEAAAAPVARLEHHTGLVGLEQGARGAQVEKLQQALIDAGVRVPGGADGWFGPATRSAVIAFQSRNGLPTSGRVDDATAAKLVGGGGTPAPTTSATTTTAPSGSSVLKQGANGPRVVELQKALMAKGVYVPGGADGVFGPATKTAVSNFQRWNQLTVTGEVDARTASKLGLGNAPATTSTTAPAPAPSPATSHVGLAQGARGDKVRDLQRALIAAGITVRGGADGVFGPLTKQALTAYQRANGLGATGRVDQATADRLRLGAGGGAAPAPAPSPAPSASNPYVGMKVGARGDRVKELQRALMETGLALRGGADGVFGNVTKSTLTLFQRLNGTPQTGVVGERDAKLLGLGSSSGPQGAATQPNYPVFGERSDRVRQLQRQLINAGISFAGGADGVFGAATAGAIMDFQRRQGLPVTGKIDATTANRLGTVKSPAPAPPSSNGISMRVFPVQGRCWFGDTWHAPRGGGRLHEGVDIIAAKGNLLYAVVDGTVSKMYWDFPGALAGNGLRIAQPDGTYFTYLHLDTFADGIEVGAKVKAGDVIGYVGNTGNSATPHLHFEIHPKGGAAINPYPLVKKIDACNVTAPRS